MSVTMILLALMVLASGCALAFAPAWIERSLFRPYWLVPKRQYLTLISSGFMHANIAHLLFNAFTLWSFGRALEATIGSGRFITLYVLGLLVSDGGTWLRHRSDPAYATLGASGAILAVLFASVVYFPKQSLYILPLPVPIPAPWFAVGYLVYTWYASRALRGRVNHDAHFSGAIAGLVFVALTDPHAWQRAIAQVFH